MTDQPKPNQPANPTPPAQPAPKDASPAADKSPTSPASSAEQKASSLPAEPKPDAAAKPAEPTAAPPVAPKPSVPANTVAPTQPNKSTTESSAAPAVPPKPTTPAPQTNAAPPVSTSAPAAPAPTNSNGVPPKPVPSETSAAPATPAAPTVPEEGKTQPPGPAPTAPTVKRDISEDPTVPGRPTESPKGTGLAAHSTTVPMSSSPLPAAPAPSGIGDKDDTIPPQGSGTKVTQRFNDPGPVTQAAGIICPSCGHRNRPGTLICDNCGTNLVGNMKAAVGTRDLVSATEAAAATNEPLLDAAQKTAVESAGGSIFSDDMVLRIEIEGGATPMLVYPKQEIILGRRDPNTGTLPDVDMTAYSGYRMGVSRTHASIHLQDKQLNLSDRGSSNGTFLNGTRLVAHRPYPVKDGDEIRLGQMVLKVYFQSNKNRK